MIYRYQLICQTAKSDRSAMVKHMRSVSAFNTSFQRCALRIIHRINQVDTRSVKRYGVEGSQDADVMNSGSAAIPPLQSQSTDIRFITLMYKTFSAPK